MRIKATFGFLLIISFFFQFGLAQSNQTENQNSVSKNPEADLESKAAEFANQWNGESIRRSIDLYSKLSNLYQKSGKFPKAAQMLRESARSSFLLEDYEASLASLKKSLLLEKNNSNSVGRIESLGLLTLVYYQKGDPIASEKSLNEGLEISKSIDYSPARAELYSSAAELKYSQQKVDESINYAKQAITLWQENQNLKREAETLLTLGFAYLLNDDLFTAQATLQESLEKFRKIGDKRGEAFAYYQLAYFYFLFNEPQKSLETCLYAATLFPDDIDFVQKARLFSGISSIYHAYGDLKSALIYRQKTLEFFKKGKYPTGELATLPTLIDLSFKIGDQESAFKYFQTAKEISGKLKDEFNIASANLSVADFYKRNNSDEIAIKHYQIALNHFNKSKNSKVISQINNNLGEVYLRQKNFSLARKHLELSLELSRKSLDKFAQAQALQNLAELSFLENNEREALEKVKESIAITDYLTANTVNSRLESSYFSNVYNRYELYIKLLMKLHRQSPTENYAIEGLQALEKSRARIMLENLSLSEADFTKDVDPETIKREKEIRVLLNTKTDKLTDLLSRNLQKSEIEETENEINELNNELEIIKAHFKQQSPLYSAIKNPAPFDVGEFQKNVLDDNSLLLAFSLESEESYLWLIGKNEFSSYILPPGEQIESKIQVLRDLLASRVKLKDESIEQYQTRIAQADEDYRKAANELSRDIFGQVAEKFGNKRLIIVPDGKLSYFPVSALPIPDSNSNEPLLLSNEVIYAPSASTLTMLVNSRKQAKPPPKSLLIFSDPVFTGDDARLLGENPNNLVAQTKSKENFRFVESLNSLERLDYSKTEADSIIETLGKSNTDSFSGFSANRENLLNANLTDYKIIHFATHGLIDEERPELSGIVLSRFNENNRRLDEFFRLHDIYGMNLNADLVVLSACSTGIGKEVKGEGLTSLNNAFLSVGAKSVVSSLWKVEDGATLELMKNFYDLMENEQLTPSEALQKAQIKLRQNPQYQSPFYWAAFTIQGDFHNPTNLAKPFSYRIYLFLLLPLVIFGMYCGYRFIQRRKHN